MSTFIVGIDLGQAQDHSALVALEKRDAPDAVTYLAGHIDRLPVGTPYPEQVRRLGQLVKRLEGLGGSVRLVVDQTGVGRPVVDMLRDADLKPVAVTITGGDKATREGSEWRTPKRDLVSTVQVLLQAKRLRIAPNLRHAQTLVDELLAFKVSITPSGHDRYGNDVGLWRENPHDDLVLACALGCWWGERRAVSLSSLQTKVHKYAK